MLQLALLIFGMFALQAALSVLQMRHFSREFISLLDDDGVIQEGRMLFGVTCFARVRPLPGFEGKHVGSLTETDLPRHGKNLRRAILDARNTYNKFISGQEIPQPPSPFQRAGRLLTGKT